jgi:hypothetical protein
MREYSGVRAVPFFDDVVALEAVRVEQAAAVMPLVGPLLDIWDQVPEVLKARLRLIGLGEHLDLVEAAAGCEREEVAHGRD